MVLGIKKVFGNNNGGERTPTLNVYVPKNRAPRYTKENLIASHGKQTNPQFQMEISASFTYSWGVWVDLVYTTPVQNIPTPRVSSHKSSARKSILALLAKPLWAPITANHT